MLAVPGYSTKGIPLIPAAMRPSSAETTCATMLFADLHGYDCAGRAAAARRMS